LVGRGLAPIDANHLDDTVTELIVPEGTANAMLALVSGKLVKPEVLRTRFPWIRNRWP
jgi:hypothetical protein